ncbi:ExeM/NucH family extracellular endonuclease [Sanguibacter keddieii]|uniref:ExeM/NucH family extracellular endonuclease n=1 Tax=Sanguibacter keddieii TaxID=60920 RepID=UPI00066175BB|nr:ExeM/NucH family extracellular endonuclease [Sanguibacter keddieii]
MKCGTRSLAVLGALALSAMGLVPAAWAADVGQADSGQSAQVDAAQSGEERPGLVDTPIPDIQAVGEGDDSAMVGATVTTLGVVTAAYPAAESGLGATLDGYTIQTPGSGGAWEPGRTRSDGIFVYAGNKGEIPAPGTCVRVTGTVGEFPATSAKGNPQSLTQLAATSVSEVEGCQAPTPIPATRVPTPDEAEALESMLLAPQGTWTITDNYQTNQYGTLTLTPGESPLRSATDVVAPGQAAREYEAANVARAIALDDGTNTNLQKGAATEAAYAYLANGSPARVGYHVAFTKPVVLEPRHGSFVFQPTSMVAGHPDRSPVTITGERPSAPTVGGDTRVATFNVLNYFSDLGVDEAGCKGYPDRTGAFVTAKNCKVRGAFSREAFANQEAKIVSAINALDADVVALEEIENPVAVGVGTDRDASLARLVEALNKDAGAGTWAYVPSPKAVPEAEDVIRVAFIYKPATVAPVGPSLIHDDPAFTGLARQPLAQEFARVTTERVAPATFVVVANHFKSKGSVPEGAPAGNVDSGDGQGNANAIRVAQAGALATFAARFADKPTLLVGDFNSYSQEDPIKALEAAGWERVSGGGEASYVYAGRSGSLDHVFANAAAKPLLAGVTSWAVNAQESIAFEYSRAGMNAHLAVEADNPYRSSDHNPELIGLTLLGGDAPAPTPSADPSADPSSAPSAAPPAAVPSASPAAVPSRAATASSRKAPTRAAAVSGLARTGADADRAIGIGILLAAIGGGLILVAHRRRRRG